MKKQNKNLRQYLKNNLPQSSLSTLKRFRKYFKLVKHKMYYEIIKSKLFLAGLYFTIFQKKYKNKGVVLYIPYDLTDFKFRGRFTLHKYEVEEAKYIDKYLPEDAKVLELGGCLGYVSCLINKKLKDKTQQVSLEANPKLIRWIKKNRDENNCLFSIENSIISHKNENVFYFHNRIVGGSIKRKTNESTIVNGVDIDFLNKKYNIIFDTLVMDIEGGELELIKKHKESLSNFKRIFFEVHPFSNILTKEEAKTCEKILISIGFRLLIRDGNFQIWEKLTYSQ